MTKRTVDSSGRVTLGKEFAGQMVEIRRSKRGDRVTLRLRVIPANETWLYANEKALAAVRRGLAQAKARQFVDGPDL